MASRKPIAFIFGKARAVVEEAQKLAKGEMEIPHVFFDSTPATVSKLRSILAAGPSPDYIFTGNGFTADEFAAHHNVEGAENITWIYGVPKGWTPPADRKPGPPTAEELVDGMRSSVKALREREEDTQGKVWTWSGRWYGPGAELYEGKL